MEAEIILDYENVETASAIAKAVAPDNLKVPEGLEVQTTNIGSKVRSRIRCSGKRSTFMATIDDLLSCISTSEGAIQTAMKI